MKKVTVFVFLFFMSGCSGDWSLDPIQETDFGALYNIVQSEDSPVITDGMLIVTVGYGGCNGGHSFELRNRKVHSSADLWLFKETEDQPCDAYFEENLEFDLPDQVLNSDSIYLITPSEERILIE